jgi:cytochrome bd-type quinol oxidase subunit 2
MGALARFLGWFLLVPYFAVKSLNVPPWIGEDRENANRTNAQLTIALIISFVGFGLLVMAGKDDLIDRVPSWLFGIIGIVPTMLVTAVVLNRDREQRLGTAYRSMPRWERMAFGLSTLALVSVMFWVAMPSQTRTQPMERKSLCDPSAQEVTAATCSEG